MNSLLKDLNFSKSVGSHAKKDSEKERLFRTPTSMAHMAYLEVRIIVE
jgi:hypothetical protein